jgi:hypothetical protein
MTLALILKGPMPAILRLLGNTRNALCFSLRVNRKIACCYVNFILAQILTGLSQNKIVKPAGLRRVILD